MRSSAVPLWFCLKKTMNNIAFPLLGLSFDIDPVAVKLPFLGGIRWYGVIIAVGIIAAVLYCSLVAKRENENPEVITDTLLYALPVSVLCARTYYVVFSWDSYRNNFWDVFKIWEGGIAIYGAVIGAVISAWIYFKVKKLNVLKMFDICCMGLLIGQIIGRWGNFVNAEAYGGYCGYFWGMSINGGECVHPTFLYESLWNLLGFVILIHLHKKRPFYGYTFFCYLSWYGVGRFFIEGLRSDSLYLGGMRVSQLVALFCVITGVCALNILSQRHIAQKQGSVVD
ncbi:MAG: prolipoprotein diacylglyceryl transferase [Ruminococcaceae bacterium]|nr:prolipoprotein diacylglyceryl transferase [Oscillospiraceae bacterium]